HAEFTLPNVERCGSPVLALSVMSNGMVASRPEDDTIRIWSPTNYAEANCIHGLHSIKSSSRLANRSFGPIRALASLGRDRLAYTCGDQTIEVVDLQKGAATIQMALSDNCQITALAALQNGGLASGSLSQGVVHLWETESGQEVGKLEGHTDTVRT